MNRMPFGKHKGELLTSVPTEYLNWLVRNVELRPGLRWAVDAELLRRFADSGGRPPPRSDPPTVRADPDALRSRVLDAVQGARRKLAAGLHPDRGGDTRAMQAVNGVFDDLAAAISRAFSAAPTGRAAP